MGASGAALLPPESVGHDQGQPQPQLGHPAERRRAESPAPGHQGWKPGAQSLWTAVCSVLNRSGFSKVGFLTGLQALPAGTAEGGGHRRGGSSGRWRPTVGTCLSLDSPLESSWMGFVWEVLFRQQDQGLQGGKLGGVQAALVLSDTGPTAAHTAPSSGTL